jgi:uncharacterized protein with NAD-binding domain and iron-sulfur cluster/ubiquinone/menaquinone biosynthesis C-methylase UbiE
LREEHPIRVAIIGGGCASIATAFELSRPEHDGKYEITVYQQGWRLGGKGASGRGPSGRIEEHGLHLWMGHYDNAFRLIRDCYEELNRDPRTCPLATWTDAFKSAPYVGLTDRTPEGQWQKFMAHFPPFEGVPGDPYTDANPLTIPAFLGRAAGLLATLILSALKDARGPVEGDGPWRFEPEVNRSPEKVTLDVRRLLIGGRVATLTFLMQGALLLKPALAALPIFPSSLATQLIDAIAVAARQVLEPLLDEDDESRYLWEIIDLVIASLKGSLRYDLVTNGFESINHFDSRDWLKLNGASDRALNSAFLRGLYDLAFAYEDGDPNRAKMAAGEGLWGNFRLLFTYRKSLFWKMRAGMGDAVFAPYYEVLIRRGVRFQFFHRLENVSLADEVSTSAGKKPYVHTLEFDVQARVIDGGPYRPLIDVHGLPCWPAEPDWQQLEDGARLKTEERAFENAWDRRYEEKKELAFGKDFDWVVLGVGLGVIPQVCRDFLDRDARWRSMVDHVKTVSTQCFQLWMKNDLASLGWQEPPPTLSGFVKPFDTWADMTHLVPAEDWASSPKAIAYFCSALPEGPPPDLSTAAYPFEQRERVRQNAISFLNQHIVHLWPEAGESSGAFRWNLLADPSGDPEDGSVGEDRFSTQFWTANVNPTDRYVQSLPGTVEYRISPLDDTYDNLTVAGDWTECGLNLGCVEAAVMSGRLAAHRVSRQPRLEEIFGYTSRKPTVDKRSAVNGFYGQLFADQLLREFYGDSGFANLGYWRANTTDAAAASNSLVEEVLAQIPTVGSRVLDVACGEGGSTHRLAGYVSPSAITAIGISQDQLKAARQRAPGSSFSRMDAADLGFADSSFDTVLCMEAAFHFHTREAFLREALRVLKPGGYLAMSDLLMALGTPLVPRKNHVSTPRAYRELLERCGFVDVMLSDATEQTWRAYRRRLTEYLIRESSRRVDATNLAGRLVYVNMMCAWAIRHCVLTAARKPTR